MNEKERKKRLKNRKVKYFLTAVLVYMVLFLVMYLAEVLISTVFNLHPYILAAVTAVMMILDIWMTGKILDRRYPQN